MELELLWGWSEDSGAGIGVQGKRKQSKEVVLRQGLGRLGKARQGNQVQERNERGRQGRERGGNPRKAREGSSRNKIERYLMHSLAQSLMSGPVVLSIPSPQSWNVGMGS